MPEYMEILFNTSVSLHFIFYSLSLFLSFLLVPCWLWWRALPYTHNHRPPPHISIVSLDEHGQLIPYGTHMRMQLYVHYSVSTLQCDSICLTFKRNDCSVISTILYCGHRSLCSTFLPLCVYVCVSQWIRLSIVWIYTKIWSGVQWSDFFFFDRFLHFLQIHCFLEEN